MLVSNVKLYSQIIVKADYSLEDTSTLYIILFFQEMSGWTYNIVSLNLSLSIRWMNPQDVADETENASSFFVSFAGKQIQFFIVVEKKVLCQVPNMQSAIF